MKFAVATMLLCFSFSARALDAKLPEGWQEATRSQEVIVFFRANEKAQAREIVAYTELDAPPETSFATVTDFENYPKFMPYVKESRIIRKSAPVDLLLYGVTAAPFIPDRDYFMRVKFTKGTTENGGVFKSVWTSEPDTEPEKQGIVRMRINEGSWTFEPIDGGKRTRATYALLSNPGGFLPRFIVDQASVSTIPNIINAIKERLKQNLKAPH